MRTDTSFYFKPADVDRLVGKTADIIQRERKLLLKKVQDITNVVMQTARAKRPIITAAEMHRSGRTKRVSNPNASFGVPVDTGALQISIKSEVKDSGKFVIGSVYVDSNVSNPKTGRTVQEYAKAIEFGTSKMAPRSFLRSAIHVNKDWIKKRFAQKEATLLGRF